MICQPIHARRASVLPGNGGEPMGLTTRINEATIASRIAYVRRRHSRLQDLVAAEQRKSVPDPWILQTLKRERLRLKDVLHRYEGLQRTLSRGHNPA